jgi:hypothetical protein
VTEVRAGINFAEAEALQPGFLEVMERGGAGNGATAIGPPSYRAHPRLYLRELALRRWYVL